MTSIDSFPGREVVIAGKHYLYFGGTAYLGLQTHAGFQELFIQNIKKYGTNYGASRKSNIKLSIFEKAETSLAKMAESEACITVSSGYLAGKLVAEHFDTDRYHCFYAPNTHSALFQKGTVTQKNFDELVKSIGENAKTCDEKTIVLFIDSIDTKEACYPDFKSLKSLPLDKIILVVDDSHGIGILGKNGGGVYARLQKLSPKELMVCCSLGKGFGIQAGTVLGTENRIHQLTRTEFFGGASPAAPAALASYYEGHSIFKKQREVLKKNLLQFLTETNDLNRFHYVQDHPVFTFSNPELTAHLESHEILTTNFKYPNDKGVLMSRIVISAAHTKTDVRLLTDALNAFN